MNNLQQAKNAINKSDPDAYKLKVDLADSTASDDTVVIRITGESARKLFAIGVKDLRDYFLPEKLDVAPEDTVVEMQEGRLPTTTNTIEAEQDAKEDMIRRYQIDHYGMDFNIKTLSWSKPNIGSGLDGWSS